MRLLPSLCILAFLLTEVGTTKADECKDILQDGIFARTSIRTNYYGRLVLAARAARSKSGTSEGDRKIEGTIPIEGVPVGGLLSDRQFRQWQEFMNSSLEVDSILSKQSEILVSSGDTEIVNAWKDCMVRRGGGLGIRFEEIDADTILLFVNYWPPAAAFKDGKLEPVVLQSDAVLGNLEEAGGKKLVKGLTIHPGQDLIFTLTNKRDASKKGGGTLLAVITTNIGSARAYLPTKVPIPKTPFFFRSVPVKKSTAHGIPRNSWHRFPVEITLQGNQRPEDLGDLASCVTVNSTTNVMHDGNLADGIPTAPNAGFSVEEANWSGRKLTFMLTYPNYNKRQDGQDVWLNASYSIAVREELPPEK